MPRLTFFDRVFSRYALTSALATATDFAFASLLHGVGATALWSTALGTIVGGVVSFAVGRWAFDAREGRPLSQLARFLLVWAVSAALNSGGVPWLMDRLPSFTAAWWIVRAAVYVGWNYPLARWFVFRTPDRASIA